MTVQTVPLAAGVAQTVAVTLPSGTYKLRLIYSNAPDGNGGWVLDIADANGNPLICGIPLVTGADLLAQYAYLGIGAIMFVATAGAPAAVPTYGDIGVASQLCFETP